MDEYIKREDVKKVVCEGCNERFSEEPCEPPECEILHAIKSVRAADVVPRSEAEKIFSEILALCDNAEDKLDKLFTKANDYRKGYENSVKHFKKNILELKEKYTKGGEQE